MTGFINADGSALIGGLMPNGAGQALGLDGLGNIAIQSWPLTMQLQGKSYIASSGLLNLAAGNYPLCIFNPASSNKNIVLYSLHVSSGTAAANAITVFLQAVNANPLYTSIALITNGRSGGSASAIAASCTFTSISQVLASPYIQVEISNGPVEFLLNGATLLLPAGTSSGVTIAVQTYASGYSSLTARWLEF